MSEHMKKHPISAHGHGGALIISYHHATYAIPKKVAERYIVEAPKARQKKRDQSLSSEHLFGALDKQYTKAGALLKGLRLREGLTQVEFAKRIAVTQANLSNMENGRRPIGKTVAKRIQKVFGANYRYFLE